MILSLCCSFLLLAFVLVAYADIPVHCVKYQIVGTWSVQLSQIILNNDIDQNSCGHKRPDDPKESWRSGLKIFFPITTIRFQLNQDNSAIKFDDKSTITGNWTLIYDEGIDLIFENERFTNYFYYYPDEDNGFQSNCTKTILGWYYNKNLGRGCWKAHKSFAQDDEEAEEYFLKYQSQSMPMNLQMYSKMGSFLALQPRGSISKKKKSILYYSEAVSLKNNRNSKYHIDFTNHSEIVETINSMQNKSWTAKAHQQFESKSIQELNKIAGRKSSKKIESLNLKQAGLEDVSDLPKEFDWAEVLGKVRHQQSCGSCDVFATIQIIESRLRIKYNEHINLSVQHPLDCSYYTQGCDGGFPYLIGLFGSQFEFVPEECSNYLGKNGDCRMCNVSILEKVYKVQNFRFIGGAYGMRSQRQMMTEVMNNGPIVVSFQPTNDFMYYRGGVFHSVDAEWVTRGEEKPEWERVDHSVLLYGWGETEEGLKYWMLSNSWGPSWGENGNFRMKRGVDESAVESLVEAADPVIVYRNNTEASLNFAGFEPKLLLDI